MSTFKTSDFPPGDTRENGDTMAKTANLSDSSDEEFTTSEDEDPELGETIRSVEEHLMELFDTQPSVPSASPPPVPVALPPVLSPHAYPCPDTHAPIPPQPPASWPQRPLLLRPSPGSHTKIRGVRHAEETSYMPLPGTGYCEGCTLPINTGLEPTGKSLVIDFETDWFVGTAMLRIKGAEPAFAKSEENGKISQTEEEKKSSTSSSSYFDNKKRTFQAIIRGKFTSPDIPMSECVTGQMFERPAGSLPPRFILKSAVRLISHLAPQLQAKFDGNRPRFLSPLVSTAQSVIQQPRNNNDDDDEKTTEQQQHLDRHVCDDPDHVDCHDRIRRYSLYPGADSTIELGIVEPPASDPTSVLQELKRVNNTPLPSNATCPMTSSIKCRTKARKKAFDKLYATKTKLPTFDTNTEYTFEFYQHLLVFGDTMAVDLGRAIGKRELSGMLNGQPLKFMAAHQVTSGTGKEEEEEEIRWLWSFDIWHESLYGTALAMAETN